MPTLKTDLKKKTFSCFLKILSPVHIGCDEVYEPTNFVVDETARELVIFDPFAFFAGMDAEDREKFTQICRKGTVSSILEIYKFLRRKQAQGRRVPVCSDFLSHYDQTLRLENESDIQQELNCFAIQRTAFHPHTGLAYIPGSSLKGALRTAWVNARKPADKIEVGKGKYAGGDMEKKILKYNMIESDPFRLVKVSDFMPVKNVQTRIVYAVNEKKKLSKFEARGPYQILEVICPGAVFAGEITVEEKHKDAPIQSPVSAEKLLPVANTFYMGEKQREEEELREIGAGSSPEFSADKLALVRIGRHCGAESLTIEGYRNILIRGKGRDYTEQNHATTLWLASEQRKYTGKQNLVPFGWTELLDERAEREKVRKAEEAAAAEIRKQAEAAEAEARKQAEFAAMSKEDQAIAQLRDPAVPEQKVTEIFNGLDNFSPDRKTDLAAAFKERWMKENGKWGKKKECSKKQWEKVSRIKEILGE